MNSTETSTVLDDRQLAEQYRNLVAEASGHARQAKLAERAAQKLMADQAAARARWKPGAVLVRGDAGKLVIRAVGGEFVDLYPGEDRFIVQYLVSDWLRASKKWSIRTRRVSEHFLVTTGWEPECRAC